MYIHVYWPCCVHVCGNMSYIHSTIIRVRIERFVAGKNVDGNMCMPSVLFFILSPWIVVVLWVRAIAFVSISMCFASLLFLLHFSFCIFRFLRWFSARAHGVCQSIRQSNYSSFGEYIYFAVGYIFPAECLVKSACSSISIDCVKQSSSVHRTAHVLISGWALYRFMLCREYVCKSSSSSTICHLCMCRFGFYVYVSPWTLLYLLMMMGEYRYYFFFGSCLCVCLYAVFQFVCSIAYFLI